MKSETRFEIPRIILASHQEHVLSRWFEAFDNSWEVHVVKNKQELLALLKALHASVVLIHLRLPELHDGEGISMLHQVVHEARLLVLSDQPDTNEERQLLRAGMHGYLNTYSAPRLIQKAVAIVRDGDLWVQRKLLAELFDEMRDQQSTAVLRGMHPELRSLTRRERDIALLVAEGNCNRSIADQLGVTERTVKTHLTHIFEKTGTKDRVHLALLINGAPHLLAS